MLFGFALGVQWGGGFWWNKGLKCRNRFVLVSLVATASKINQLLLAIHVFIANMEYLELYLKYNINQSPWIHHPLIITIYMIKCIIILDSSLKNV